MNWKDAWNQKAQTNHIFSQMGRRDYTIFQFFLMCRDMAVLLKFIPDDIVLDAGAGSGNIQRFTDIGFKKCIAYSVNQIFTQGRYTFDLVVVK
jgi:hypothetical protein